ncbi:LANO_0E00584g1_1 [Lachancea nothofagi CBS 11611]|uniref:LANO_0E00584g1_1 n=1 Tax=Lachancea nothofagi CBS 11611 TaxID=1266666 RepID=A0A1G4JNV4_9SACH|nr:LANO_0E00584g1_1 [Lachancea nothofagi CBS 11611]
MSRAKEIQEKLGLQASLQTAFNDSKLKAFEWLEDDLSKDCSEDLTSSKSLFHQLPVIGLGAGLSFDQTPSNNNDAKEDISTIGEFINSDKKVSSLAKKKKRKMANGQEPTQRSVNSVHEISAGDTRAMIALKRKIKNSHRGELRSKLGHQRDVSGEVQPIKRNTSSDSEDEDEPRVEKTTKKSFGLLFQGKRKKR